MSRNTNSLIDTLVDDLRPKPPMKRNTGLLCAGFGAAVTALAVILMTGLRPDLSAGHFDPVYLLSSGAFLILSYAATYGVIQLSQPFVGNHQTGWRWASAMAALLPASALLTLAVSWAGRGPSSLDGEGWKCLVSGLLFGLLLAAVLVFWLRRGAPTSPDRAGLMTGIAAGACGIFAFGLHCPHNDIVHIGIWHGSAVIVSALIGRAVVPRLVRW